VAFFNWLIVKFLFFESAIFVKSIFYAVKSAMKQIYFNCLKVISIDLIELPVFLHYELKHPVQRCYLLAG